MFADPHSHDGPTSPHQRSRGVGRLSVKRSGDQTRIENLYQQGCSKIRLPTPGDEGLQAIMINSSGGLTGGDRLDWSFELEDHTALTVTSQACERIYAASEDIAQTSISLVVGEGARLAWLPQETILFDNGAFARSINVELAKNAELLMVEPIIFGRQAMEEKVLNGWLKDSWRISRDGQLLHAEEAAFGESVDNLLQSRAVTSGQLAAATVLLIADRAEGLIEPARKVLGPGGGASCWDGKLLARMVAEDGYCLRKRLVALISMMNRDTPLPKIWAL